MTSEIDSVVGDRSEFVGVVVAGNDRILKAADDDPRGSNQVRGMSVVSDVLAPPYEPETLLHLLEHSNALRPNVDAYATNIDGMGHRFEPVIDLDAANARDAVSDAILIEKYAGVGSSEQLADAQPPTDAEIDQRIAQLREMFRIEKFRSEVFFEQVCVDESFVKLRRKTRSDLEVTGNAFWEIERTQGGGIAQIWHAPSRTLRLMKKDKTRTSTTIRVRVSPLKVENRSYSYKFRRFVDISGDSPIYFKEFGDPRVMSDKTGRYYPDLKTLQGAIAAGDSGETGAQPANEILHFKVDSSRSAYGIPRWIGSLLSVCGSRSAEEVNFLYFQNKSIPPLVITVSGGRMSANSVERIKDYINNEIRGKNNFHKILILEAEAPGTAAQLGLDNAGKCRIEVKPLTNAQLTDALFMGYDERNMDKVGMTFRLPRLLRGDVRDFNRATADAALQFAETQVFSPERADFDFLINLRIMPLVGVSLWRFASNGLRLHDPEVTAKVIGELAAAGGLTPNDVRRVGGQSVLGQELVEIDEEWADLPLPLAIERQRGETAAANAETAAARAATTAQNQPKQPSQPQPEGAAPTADAVAAAKRTVSALIEVRDSLVEGERVAAEKKDAAAAAAEQASVTRHLTAEEMADLFGIEVA